MMDRGHKSSNPSCKPHLLLYIKGDTGSWVVMLCNLVNMCQYFSWLCSLHHVLWQWRQQVPLKCRYISTWPHSVVYPRREPYS